MSDQPQTPRSHLFTLRVWHEDLGDGRQEWRGKLHHVANDDVTYFRGVGGPAAGPAGDAPPRRHNHQRGPGAGLGGGRRDPRLAQNQRVSNASRDDRQAPRLLFSCHQVCTASETEHIRGDATMKSLKNQIVAPLLVALALTTSACAAPVAPAVSVAPARCRPTGSAQDCGDRPPLHDAVADQGWLRQHGHGERRQGTTPCPVPAPQRRRDDGAVPGRAAGRGGGGDGNCHADRRPLGHRPGHEPVGHPESDARPVHAAVRHRRCGRRAASGQGHDGPADRDASR